MRKGKLIESVGGYRRSAIYEKDLDSGRVLREARIPPAQFAEGATVFGEHIVQLTWRDGIAYVRDALLRPIREVRYEGEGWGLTQDGQALIVSDGSAELAFRSPDSFALQRRVAVRDGARPVAMLNELEFARGLVFANVWMTDRVALIDPDRGAVRAWLDLSALKGRFAKPATWNQNDHVLNGIAYDAARDRFYVTGKCWPTLFELEIEALPQ